MLGVALGALRVFDDFAFSVQRVGLGCVVCSVFHSLIPGIYFCGSRLLLHFVGVQMMRVDERLGCLGALGVHFGASPFVVLRAGWRVS